MNALDSLANSVFDAVLGPLEAIAWWFSLIVVSGVFGVLALLVFKHISWQKGIKRAKDKIKGHMIEIRLYQDDLGLVSKAIGKVLLRNLQYVVLNFGPFLPLMIPFGMVAAQLVVRYGFDPAPVHAQVDELLAGQGQTFEIRFKPDRKAAAGELELVLPEGLEQVSPLVRVPGQGRAFVELAATRGGVYDIVLRSGEHEEHKRFHAGEEGRARQMQPERGTGFLSALLWPAEPTFGADSPFELVRTSYPERDLGWLPGAGPVWVLIHFVLASMLFGFLALKPLGVQI